MPKITVIGIGYRPLDQRATEALLASDIVLASNRLMEVFPDYSEYPLVKDRLKVINNVDEIMAFIDEQIDADPSVTIGLIASGDPMFHGIAKRILGRFDDGFVEIMPDLSSVQIASSLTRESWDDALLISLHGGPNPEKRRKLPYEMADLPYLLSRHHKIFILTDRQNNPTRIAETLAGAELSRPMRVMMYVCEQLGYPTEQVSSGSPAELVEKTFLEPNIVVLKRVDPVDARTLPVFGLREEEIEHSRGLITKDEVRAAALHKLTLPSSGIVWDIGSGSGAVALEIANTVPGLTVYAIEKDEEQLANIRANRAKFGMFNIEVVAAGAPGAFASLPAPDRVFVGGSGGRMQEILAAVSERMQHGVVVINASQIETLNTAVSELKNHGFQLEVCQISTARMKEIGEGNFFAAQNPVFVIRGER